MNRLGEVVQEYILEAKHQIGGLVFKFLNQWFSVGDFWPPVVTWQCLGTFSVIKTSGTIISRQTPGMVEGLQPSPMHSSSPQKRNSSNFNTAEVSPMITPNYFETVFMLQHTENGPRHTHTKLRRRSQNSKEIQIAIFCNT